MLELTVPQLGRLAASAYRMYRLVPQLKSDGTLRETWDAQPQLKSVHEILKVRLLQRVQFPLYLQGSIRDKENPRDYKRNAAFHTQKKCVVTLDIASFFPSVTVEHIKDIWSNFFRFDKTVADTLTALTTKDGYLPQGAKTSSYLANLVFWRSEHDLVDYLDQLGWTYSRLVDDVTISITREPSKAELTKVNKTVIGYLQRHGFSIKRPKHEIFYRHRPMKVNNLIVNERPALPKNQRHKIRAQVHTLNQQLAAGEVPDLKFVRCTEGKVIMLRRFHPENRVRILDVPQSLD
ncbi:MAG: reverse transcriptase family protein [Burkholderiales bacterium]